MSIADRCLRVRLVTAGAWHVIRSFAMFSAAITAIRSRPTILAAVADFPHAFAFRISAESKQRPCVRSAGQATWYSLSRIRTLTCGIHLGHEYYSIARTRRSIRRAANSGVMLRVGAIHDRRSPASAALFHCFESADHRLDPAPEPARSFCSKPARSDVSTSCRCLRERFSLLQLVAHLEPGHQRVFRVA